MRKPALLFGLDAILGHLRAGVACVVLLLWAGVSAAAGNIHSLKLLGGDDLLRVQIDAKVGMLGSVSMGGGAQPVLRIALKQNSDGEVQALLQALGELPASVKGLEVLPGFDGYVLLQLKLARPLRVLDETIAASPGGRSRWELVLGEGTDRQIKLGNIQPALETIGFGGQDDRLDITLSGSAALVAEVSLQEDPPRVLVDLPGVPRAHLDRVVAETDSLPAIVRGLRVQAVSDKLNRLVFDMRNPVDMVDAGGVVNGALGQVTMSVVSDQLPKAAGDARSAQALRVLEVKQGDSGGVDLALAGAAGVRLNAFTLLGPSRLVVDFLGWSPDRVRSAVNAFKSAHPLVRQAVLSETRLGSARVVFELAAPVGLAFRGDLQGVYGRDARDGRVVIGLGMPGPGSMMAYGGPRPLDLRLRRDMMDLRQPQVVIRPMQLEGEYATAQIPDTPVGKRFNLINLLESALLSDSRYGAAKAEYQANAEAIPQARAGYLPVAAFDYQRSNVGQTVRESVFPTGSVSYPSKSSNLTITQPLIRLQSIIRMGQANVSVEQAKLNLLAAEQDLILRVASAYLGLLAARDAVDLTRAERETTESQLEVARTRLQGGLGTVVHVHETEARFALAKARELEALNREEDARAALKEIVGEEVSGVHGFKADFIAAEPRPSRAEAWVQAALDQNLALQARNLAVEIAGLEIRRQQAGHLPTVDAFGSLSRQETGGSLYGAGQYVTNRELGVRLRVPIFEGGMTSSLVREAEARRDKAHHERDQEFRRTERLARSAFLGVQTSVASLEALRQNVVAQESALETKQEGFRSGLQTIVSVVDAYRLYFAARRDYLQARYEYLVNRLKLKQSVGTLSRNDLNDLAALLER